MKMQKLDFNQNWICRCITREEPAFSVTLPHDAMRAEPRGADSLGEGNISWHIAGDYEYTKTFTVPEDYANKAVVLEFEGVYHKAEVYINGEKAAFRPYGYTNFYVEANRYLRYGQENEIRVIAHNAEQPNSRWYSGTGIYRPVWLYVLDEKHIELNGVKIRTLSYDPAIIEVRVATSAPEGRVDVEICDGGETVARASGEASVSGARFEITVPEGKLWGIDSPNLYTCRASYVGSVAEETFGIRKLDWGPDSGLTLNGKRVILRGACFHHDNGVLGACAYPEAEERKVRIMKENGYNALRSSHYPCSKAILDACDRLGMLMMDEYVDVWYIHKTRYDYVDYLMDWWRQDFRDMVDKDYNHPCVIMYSTGNEVAETAQEKGIALTQAMTDYLHELDGTRPVTCGINIFFNFLSSAGFGVYSDEKANSSADKARTKQAGKPKKKPVGSEFYNTLAVLVGDSFMKFGATLPPCDWKTRGAYAATDIAGYNYGLWRYKKDLKKYPDRLILGSETFCKDAYKFYELARDNPRIIGDFVWTGWDYIGEVCASTAEFADYRPEAEETCMTGCNGRIDLNGKPRADAAFTKVAFDLEKGPFMAVWPVYEREKPSITGWQLTRGLESWSYRGCAGQPARVEVYARAAAVELLVNGRSVGRKKLKNKCRAVFNTVYEDGELTAVAYDAAGEEIGRQIMKTAGEETVLRITPESSSVKPKGLVFIPMQYTDSDGVWKPMEKHTLKVSVKNGRLVGLGHAGPYVEGNYTDDTTKTYFGEAMAVAQADGGGPVQVTVTDEAGEHCVEIPCRA